MFHKKVFGIHLVIYVLYWSYLNFHWRNIINWPKSKQCGISRLLSVVSIYRNREQAKRKKNIRKMTLQDGYGFSKYAFWSGILVICWPYMVSKPIYGHILLCSNCVPFNNLLKWRCLQKRSRYDGKWSFWSITNIF